MRCACKGGARPGAASRKRKRAGLSSTRGTLGRAISGGRSLAMHAMILVAPGKPMRPAEMPVPVPGPGQVRVRVTAYGVSRTDLHVVDGELPHPRRPVIPGHE